MRKSVLETLADAIAAINLGHPVRVGIDGVTAAGKTVLADELVDPLKRRGRPVIRAAADGFHHPPEIRHRNGRECPEGYYRDSFDYPAIRQHLLDPLGPGGSRRYRPHVFDFRTEGEAPSGAFHAASNSILLFEGVMLFRTELDDAWDYRVFVHADFDISLDRALARDLDHFGSEEAIRRKHSLRFRPAQQRYLAETRPADVADAWIDNNNPEYPVLELRPNTGHRAERSIQGA